LTKTAGWGAGFPNQNCRRHQEHFMSIAQAIPKLGLVYQLVGMRATGEKVIMSEHFNLAVARKVLSFVQYTGSYAEIFIECNGKRLGLDS
jgi:hypothetical protein